MYVWREKKYCGTDGGIHGGGWILNSIQFIGRSVEVLWSLWGDYFNPFLCSGDLRGMVVNMLTCS